MADNRIAYGLAKKYGIDTSGMSPKEVWEALKKKGITEKNISEGAYDSKDNSIKERANKVGKVSFKEDFPEKTKTTIKNIENKTKGLNYEVGTIIDKDGNILQSVDGKSNEVNVEKSLLKNAIFTHNHPNGSCFSYDDIQSFLDGEVYQLRATTDKGKTYILTRTKDFVDPSLAYNYKKACGLGGEGQNRIQELTDNYLNSGYELSKAVYLAKSDYREEWLTQNGKNYNVKFEVEWDE